MKKVNDGFNEVTFQALLKETSVYFEKKLNHFLNSRHFGILREPIDYAICGTGKRLRPLLCMETSKVFDVPKDKSIFAAIAIECIHTYSLIHDDLPSMDNDDLRRGKLTLHKKWNEATAILVGDALQSLGFEVLSSNQFRISDKIKIELIYSLANKSGPSGMVLGQALDMEAEANFKQLDLKNVSELQAYKTGKLISWCCEVGPILAEKDTRIFSNYAAKIGLAFQIIDDVLDVTSSTASLGKKVGKDFKKNKATFVSRLGVDRSIKKASALVDEACDCVSIFGQKSQNLKQIAKFILHRKT